MIIIIITIIQLYLFDMNKLRQSNLLNSDVKQITTQMINTINSQHLLDQKGVANIYHQGEIYQLRQTRAGKLILTK
ncbi:hemin uptake protein HemP [Arsenophonus sp.]|uniref:hemin uptake protein HemP n=2 Tax=Arsenophonus TaxID=637 RepID=UPI00387A4C60